jgi:hypothetical protein
MLKSEVLMILWLDAMQRNVADTAFKTSTYLFKHLQFQ